MPVEVKVFPSDSIEKALRSFKNRVAKSGILAEAKERRYFVPKSVRRRLAAKKAKGRRRE